ncbi:MAG: DNA ligase [Proteobacteria bacterium]|nr:DNA ligase [Pseudomonadota bacterium]
MDKVDMLVQTLKNYSNAYRQGKPLVSDEEYDRLLKQLSDMDPSNPYLEVVEPERFEGKSEVRHPMPMLSTEKAYSTEDLERFVTRVHKAAADIGLTDVHFAATAKLDGLAGRDDGTIFASRGNGMMGYEISSAFAKGVIPMGGRGRGLGEIVMSKSYFDEHLAGQFEHPRNMVVGIVSSDTLNEFAEKALNDGAVHFVPYTELPTWTGSGTELVASIEKITLDLLGTIDYPVDGLVAEVVDEALKRHMGATNHHYRWQIAIKTKGETAFTRVENIVWQVGRTGNVTPVMEVAPVKLSGATIRRVTAHHAGMVKNLGIGQGADIEIIRSGEVIPKLVAVINSSGQVDIPRNCPVCGTSLVWQNDFLRCTNALCPAQIEQKIVHWFKSLGNADWFGIKTVQKLVNNGFDSLEKIYAMTEDDFVQLGFGPVQSKNLHEALSISRRKSVEDWRFLSAFGISALGKGDSRKLLAHVAIESLVTMTAEDIKAIHGFGDITSESIIRGLSELKETMAHMLDLGFNLQKTDIRFEGGLTDSPISGKGIVFTGKMERGSRDDIQDMARRLGATVQTAVSGKTDFLVCGENVGAKKIEKARETGCHILSEEAFYQMVGPVTGVQDGV